jgi:hypothetical protein
MIAYRFDTGAQANAGQDVCLLAKRRYALIINIANNVWDEVEVL